MAQLQAPRTYHGGCHCGSVRFQVLIDHFTALDCNCSICRKKGFLHLIVPAKNFQLLQGEEHLTNYRFNTKVAQHIFCSHCGIHAFYRPRSHPDCIDVNLRCLDRDTLEQFTIRPFDGQNWEDNVAQIRD
ncbi:MAG: GFA family protein [Cyanobacteria bacterium J06588_4]